MIPQAGDQKKNLLLNLEFVGIQGSLKPENAEGVREKEKKKKMTQGIMIKEMP